MIEIFVDGLAEPRNPGVGTYGFVIYRDGKKIKEEHGFVGENVTNNYAEYVALERALASALPLSEEEIVVKSDSRLLVNQMTGEWRPKRGMYIEKHWEAKELAQKFKSLRFIWVPREQNYEADLLSRVAYEEFLRKKRSSG